MKENKILHSQILGEGTPFLILHGLLGMGDNWKTLANQYKEEGFEVHLIDLRNHGRSFHSDDFSYEFMVTDLKNYCDVHNLSEIVLMGHSMGGKVAMFFAAQYPEMVQKLIVADISPRKYPPHHDDIMEALQALDVSTLQSRGEAEERLSKYLRSKTVRLFLLKNLYRKNKTEFGLRMNLDVVANSMEEVGVPLNEDAVYSGETLFIKGSKSDYIQESDEPLIKKHFPNASVEIINDAGHWLHAEQPEEFYNTTLNFIKE